MIDFALLAVVGFVALTPFEEPKAALAQAQIAAMTISPIVYRPIIWRYRDGQTLGQRLLHIRTVNTWYRPLSLGGGVWRVLATWIVGFIPFAGRLSLLSMLWNHERRTWFDRWSDARIISTTRSENR